MHPLVSSSNTLYCPDLPLCRNPVACKPTVKDSGLRRHCLVPSLFLHALARLLQLGFLRTGNKRKCSFISPSVPISMSMTDTSEIVLPSISDGSRAYRPRRRFKLLTLLFRSIRHGDGFCTETKGSGSFLQLPLGE